MNNRRNFLKLAGASAIAMMFPATINAAKASRLSLTRKKLIVLTLEGGCDTLNMFIPNLNTEEESKYLELRGPGSKSDIAIPKEDTLPLEGTIYSLHPKLKALKDMWNTGNVALFPGTHSGDQSNTSHFFQFNFFDRGAYGSAGQSKNSAGWLARYLNNEGKVATDDTLYAYNFATSRNMFDGAETSVFGGSMPYQASIGIGNITKQRIIKDHTKPRDGELGRIVDNQKIIFARAEKVKGFYLTKSAEYPLTRDMINAMEMLSKEVDMDVVQLSAGAYDTHTGQLIRHNKLFTELNSALNVFNERADLDNTLLIVQTEFSRTLDSNGTQGTDHGKAAMWFAIGGEVKKGLYGRENKTCLTGPNDIFTSLSGRTYMKEKNDYRDVLATALKWIGANDPGAAFPDGYDFTSKDKGYMK